MSKHNKSNPFGWIFGVATLVGLCMLLVLGFILALPLVAPTGVLAFPTYVIEPPKVVMATPVPSATATAQMARATEQMATVVPKVDDHSIPLTPTPHEPAVNNQYVDVSSAEVQELWDGMSQFHQASGFYASYGDFWATANGQTAVNAVALKNWPFVGPDGLFQFQIPGTLNQEQVTIGGRMVAGFRFPSSSRVQIIGKGDWTAPDERDPEYKKYMIELRDTKTGELLGTTVRYRQSIEIVAEFDPPCMLPPGVNPKINVAQGQTDTNLGWLLTWGFSQSGLDGPGKPDRPGAFQNAFSNAYRNYVTPDHVQQVLDKAVESLEAPDGMLDISMCRLLSTVSDAKSVSCKFTVKQKPDAQNTLFCLPGYNGEDEYVFSH